MKNKFNKKVMITISFVILMLLVPFTNVCGSNTSISNNKKNSETKSLDSIKIKYLITELKTLIKIIMKLCSNYPSVVTLCQEILTKLDIIWLKWPVIVCLLIEIICIGLYDLSELIYDLGFLLASEILYRLSYIFEELLFAPHCDYLYPPINTKITRFDLISHINKLIKNNSCPCNKL